MTDCYTFQTLVCVCNVRIYESRVRQKLESRHFIVTVHSLLTGYFSDDIIHWWTTLC